MLANLALEAEEEKEKAREGLEQTQAKTHCVAWSGDWNWTLWIIYKFRQERVKETEEEKYWSDLRARAIRDAYICYNSLSRIPATWSAKAVLFAWKQEHYRQHPSVAPSFTLCDCCWKCFIFYWQPYLCKTMHFMSCQVWGSLSPSPHFHLRTHVCQTPDMSSVCTHSHDSNMTTKLLPSFLNFGRPAHGPQSFCLTSALCPDIDRFGVVAVKTSWTSTDYWTSATPV